MKLEPAELCLSMVTTISCPSLSARLPDLRTEQCQQGVNMGDTENKHHRGRGDYENQAGLLFIQ